NRIPFHEGGDTSQTPDHQSNRQRSSLETEVQRYPLHHDRTNPSNPLFYHRHPQHNGTPQDNHPYSLPPPPPIQTATDRRPSLPSLAAVFPSPIRSDLSHPSHHVSNFYGAQSDTNQSYYNTHNEPIYGSRDGIPMVSSGQSMTMGGNTSMGQKRRLPMKAWGFPEEPLKRRFSGDSSVVAGAGPSSQVSSGHEEDGISLLADVAAGDTRLRRKVAEQNRRNRTISMENNLRVLLTSMHTGTNSKTSKEKLLDNALSCIHELQEGASSREKEIRELEAEIAEFKAKLQNDGQLPYEPSPVSSLAPQTIATKLISASVLSPSDSPPLATATSWASIVLQEEEETLSS
ncbi:hypothetical protein BCR33DRAFT_723229, partial [Rhizoclosmatium globosum]